MQPGQGPLRQRIISRQKASGLGHAPGGKIQELRSSQGEAIVLWPGTKTFNDCVIDFVSGSVRELGMALADAGEIATIAFG